MAASSTEPCFLEPNNIQDGLLVPSSLARLTNSVASKIMAPCRKKTDVFVFSLNSMRVRVRVREQETYTAAGGHQQVAAQAYYMDSCQEDVSLASPALAVQLGPLFSPDLSLAPG